MNLHANPRESYHATKYADSKIRCADYGVVEHKSAQQAAAREVPGVLE